MKYFNMYLTNAFSNNICIDNTIGIILATNSLKEEEMQSIAKSLNQTETVFIEKLDISIYKTRFFTSSKELKVCYNATIATFFAIASSEYIKPLNSGVKEILQITEYGEFRIDINYEDYKVTRVDIILSPKEIEKKIDDEEILSVLGLSSIDIGLKDKNCSIKSIDNGAVDIIIPVKNYDILKSIKLNKNNALKICEEENILNINAFTILNDGTVVQRTFSPIIDIEKELISTSATANTLFYLNKYIDENINDIKIEKEINSKKTSILTGEMLDEGIIKIGGIAHVFVNGILNI